MSPGVSWLNRMEGARTGDSRYIFLDYLRAAAAWLVVWDHLVAGLPSDLGKPLPLAVWVGRNISGPLGIIVGVPDLSGDRAADAEARPPAHYASPIKSGARQRCNDAIVARASARSPP